jgi:CubicO group peptidase (beta-lactamase class C family)
VDVATAPARVTQRLDVLLDEIAAQRRISHVVMSVMSGDGTLQWSGARGVARAGGSPMTIGTPFHIASVDKLFTAAAALRLHEHGELDLDARLIDCLPPESVAGIHRIGGLDRTGDIRIANLLTHTSGLPDNLEDAHKGGRSVMEDLFEGGDRALTSSELIRITRELPAHFPPQPVHADRQKVRYSDTNFQLLIAVVQQVADMPIHEIFSEWFFEPLGMDHTSVFGRTEPANSTPERADLYVGDKPLDLPLAIESLTSIYSTLGDMTTFMQALTSGRVFENPETFSVMCSRFNRFGLPRDKATLRSPSWPIEYGFGLMRFQLPRLFTGGRVLPAVIGHTGSTGSWAFHCPELEATLVGTVDEVSSGAVPYRVVPRILRLLTTE